jgi:selenocysteine lyase/cysteine desulfurase
MKAAHELFLRLGMQNIADTLLTLKKQLVAGLQALDFEFYGDVEGPTASSITTFRHPRASMPVLFKQLEQQGIIASLRYDRVGTEFLRFSPHFYNTAAEIERALAVLRLGLAA